MRLKIFFLIGLVGLVTVNMGCSKDKDSNSPYYGNYPGGPYDPNGGYQPRIRYATRLEVVDKSDYRSYLRATGYCSWCKPYDGRPRIVVESYQVSTSQSNNVAATVTMIPFADWGNSPLQPVAYRVNFYKNGGKWTAIANSHSGYSWGTELEFEVLGDLKNATSLPIRVIYQDRLILQGQIRRN